MNMRHIPKYLQLTLLLLFDQMLEETVYQFVLVLQF